MLRARPHEVSSRVLGLLSTGTYVLHTQLFFTIWIRSNTFCNFSGFSRQIFKCDDIIRYVFLLAFQRRIPNRFTVRQKLAKIKRKEKGKLKTIAQLFFRIWIR